MAGDTGRDPYFNSIPERQALVWASAVRRQLGRWEPLVAKHLLTTIEPSMTPQPEPRMTMTSEEYWQGEIERHFLLIAARNLLKAIDLMDHPPTVGTVIRAELIEARDLVEHWTENMPVFNVTPRPRQPGYRSGKDFASRNPEHGPYSWWSWNSAQGPLVTPNVFGHQLHELVTTTIDAALAVRPGMTEYVPAVAPSPWVERCSEADEWWPKQV